MKHFFAFLFSAALGVGLIFCALQVPAHLRAVDEIVLHTAGAGTPSVTDQGLELAKNGKLGAARLFAKAAQEVKVADAEKLKNAANDLALRNPSLEADGGRIDGTIGALFSRSHGQSPHSEPVTEFLVRSENRTRALEYLKNSSQPLVQSLLRFRLVTNTTLFPPSSSTSGQALDTAVCLAGLLAESGHLSTGLNDAALAAAAEGAKGGDSQRVEQLLMDLLSLGQRFNWGQLTLLVEQIRDAETLRGLSSLVQKDDNVPVVFTAVCLSGNAAGVDSYLIKYDESGINDLKTSLTYGRGGVGELVEGNQQLCRSSFCQQTKALLPALKIVPFAAAVTLKEPGLALAAKWGFYFLGGLLLGGAIHSVSRVPPRERLLHVRGFHFVRELLFAFGFLLIVLLLSEPFLTQESQMGTLPLRFHLPTVGTVVTAESTQSHSPIMNQFSLLTLLLFFVLQALIYIACLVKLAEIRRQNVPARLKLKLLENEEHLFDAGLYLGFVGTIISLILVSLGVIKPSLMAAYSSTSFGILFVSFFKIFHLRPFRRKLLLDVEGEPPVRVISPIGTAATMPS